jgi:hypothetical protein
MKDTILNAIIDITAAIGIGLLTLYVVLWCIDEVIRGY